jgi:hypothetical protein
MHTPQSLLTATHAPALLAPGAGVVVTGAPAAAAEGAPAPRVAWTCFRRSAMCAWSNRLLISVGGGYMHVM